MAQRIPPALEHELQNYEAMRRNHETLVAMSQTMKNELTEVTATLEVLQEQADDVITYKAVGQVMFKVEKPKLVEELEDKKQTLEMRISSTNKQVEALTKKLQELKTKIELEISKRDLKVQ